MEKTPTERTRQVPAHHDIASRLDNVYYWFTQADDDVPDSGH